ncbi:MAG: Ig-like domain repeat protein, partial [Verrucomicrobiota bacterium]
MKSTVIRMLLAALALPSIAYGLPAADADPNGIVIQEVPEKTVVLTFDDSCASHTTIVAPILKQLGFGGSFYICDFDSFNTRKDWYMTWPQIKSLSEDGFEVGNHTVGHGGSLSAILAMEDDFSLHGIPKPTTVCWPLYQVNTGIYADLIARHYTFGRGGHELPYRPTSDHPFDVPSFTISDGVSYDAFVADAQRATRGRIVVFTFHGVPDGEHSSVGVAPAKFALMMQYLKDNNYNVISLNALGQYVDVAKAAAVWPAAALTPDITITDTTTITNSNTFTSTKVTCNVAVAGTTKTFGGSGSGWVRIDGLIGGSTSLVHSAPYVLELLPRTGSNTLSGVNVGGSELRSTAKGLASAPLTLTNATLRLEDPLNASENFSSLITLSGGNTVQALDNHRGALTGKMTGSGGVTYSGLDAISRISSDSDYTGATRIAQDPWYTQNSDESQGLDDCNFGIGGSKPFGAGVVTIAGTVGTRMGIAYGAGATNVIPNNMVLETALALTYSNASYSIDLAGSISGPGSLVKIFAAGDTGSTLHLRGNNTFSGGTRFFSGNLKFYQANAFGTGTVTLGGKLSSNHAVCLLNQSALTVANAFVLAGITDATINGSAPTFASVRGTTPGNLAAQAEINTNGGNLGLAGPISGSGGLLKSGSNTLTLSGSNTYSGPTKVATGTLACSSATALAGGTLDITTSAVLALNYTGTRAIAGLTFNGGSLQPAGTYGSSTSTATNKSAYFTGTGTITVPPTSSTALSLTGGTTPAALGAPLTFAATVTGNAPTGNVTFYATGKLSGTAAYYTGATVIGSSALNGTYQASLTTSNLLTGLYDITAYYTGDGNNRANTSAAVMIKVGNPDIPMSISNFNFPGQLSTTISGTDISVTLPYTATVTAVSPSYTVPSGATGTPTSGTTRDFTLPQTYTVTGLDGSTQVYTVTVNRTAISSAKSILTMTFPGSLAATISGTNIGVNVPTATTVTALAPTFTLSPLATCVPSSGTAKDFTNPQTYTVTAQDGSTQAYTVAVVKVGSANTFTWKSAAAGNWSAGANWTNNLASGTAPVAAGQSDYILNFSMAGNYSVSDDLSAGFVLNQLNLTSASAGLALTGNSLAFTRNSGNGLLPVLSAVQNQGTANISNAISLPNDLNVNLVQDKDPNVYLTLSGLISGSGGLNLNSYASDYPSFNNHDAHYGTLRITNPNTYSGGTRINGGKIILGTPSGLGTGPVTINNFGTIQDSGGSTNALTIYSGYLYSCRWDGPVTLNTTAYFYGNCNMYGNMSGPGGILMLGTPGTYLNMTPGGTITLYGTNTYTGPTTVFPGTLVVKKASGLYNADTTKWTPANIAIYKAATLRLNAGGTGEFTGPQLSTLLANLTTSVNNNGLMTGSFVVIDTANATAPATISSVIKDSQGPGGGWFSTMKTGAGTVVLTAANTFTGPMVIDLGTLSVASINSVVGGTTSSNLGTPADVLNGTINFGNPYVSNGAGGSGSGTLLYTGTGETTDREISINGSTYTTTIDQSGSGLLKFTGAIHIPGFGTNKTIVLQGASAGTGEIAGNIANPYDRAGLSTTSLTKSGSGTWTLSGANSYSGPTTVTGGTLACTSAAALGGKTLSISSGAKVALNYVGTRAITALSLNGAVKAAGIYGSSSSTAPLANQSTYFSGSGTVTVGAAGTVATITTLDLPSGNYTSAAGTALTFTATVTGGTPTGTVTFYAGSTMLSTGTLNGSRQASITTSSLAAGSYDITAVYAGNATCQPGTSVPMAIRVNSAGIGKDILTFVFPGLPATTIFGTNITVSVPHTTVVTALAPTFSVSSGATCDRVSGTTMDFTGPVHYIVTASDSTTKDYTVTVTVAALSTAKDMLYFGFGTLGSVTINPVMASVDWIVPNGTVVTNLAPTYTLSALATATPASGTSRNFTTPQTYTVTAEDGSTKVYTVTATVAPPSPAKDILSFGPGASIATSTIAWTVPFGSDVKTLAPTFTLSDLATATPPSGTSRNFTSPQTYTITAQDLTTKTYTVTVTVAPRVPGGIVVVPALWLDATQLTGLNNGDQVNTWTDMSGNANDAIRQGVSSAGYPKYVTGQLNGQPVVRFNSSSNNPGDYSKFNRISTIRSVFWVVKENAGTSDGHFLLGDDSSYDFHRQSSNGPIWDSGNASANVRNGVTKLMGTAVNGTTTSLPANSFQLISLVTTANVQANQITQDRTYHGSWQGDIAEIIIYTSALSTADETAVGSYLATKYGLTTAYAGPKTTTTTTLVSSLTPSASGVAVTFTATVAPAPTGGTVQFYDNAVALGSPVTVAGGQAQLITSALDTGSHSITASYSGSTDYAGSSTAAATSQTVTGLSSAKVMSNVVFAGLGTATADGTGTNFGLTAPYGTVVTGLAPTFTLSTLATASPPSGTSRNFTTPQSYTVTAENGSTQVYTVTLTVTPASPAKDILTFGPGAGISGNTITWTVPFGSNVAGLAPTFTLSTLATATPP